jgi:hypothetical protein
MPPVVTLPPARYTGRALGACARVLARLPPATPAKAATAKAAKAAGAALRAQGYRPQAGAARALAALAVARYTHTGQCAAPAPKRRGA